MKIITHESCTAYQSPGHPERPTRISKTVEHLKGQTALSVDWVDPLDAPEAAIARAHTPEHIAQVKAASEPFDNDTPNHPNIFSHAKKSVGGALRGLQFARSGQHSLSLLRPPGHHATRNHAMGFCYFNSIAIAALEALETGSKTIAVFDFDVHHGNGTEAILLNHPNAAFYSIHQHPCYPGTGTSDVGKNCFNFPVPPRTARDEYRKVIGKAMAAMSATKPALILVSAGFDAYARDPLAQETLEAEDFEWIGKSLAKLGIPLMSVLEGGYSTQLPDLILAYLRGISSK